MGNLRRQFTYSVRPGLTHLLGYAAVGSAGAVATDSTTSTPGFTVVRASKGTFTITLDEKALGLVGYSVGFSNAAAQSDSYQAHISAEDVDGTKIVTMKVHDAYNTMQDPISTVMYIDLAIKTSEQG